MQYNEIVEQTKDFAEEFVEKITNKNLEFSRKQTYFLDNQDELKKYMMKLKVVIDGIEGMDNISEVDEETRNTLNEAKEIQEKIYNTVISFQEDMKIDPETVNDNIPILNKENIEEVKKNSNTIKEAQEDIQESKKSQFSKDWFNYALICDGSINLLECANKKELNVTINNIVDKGNYKDIHLLSIKTTEIPLKKKTIITV